MPDPTAPLPPAQAPPPGPPPVPVATSDGSGGRPPWLIPVILAVVVVIAIVAAAAVVLTKDDDESSETAAGEIFLEPAATLGEDPFTDEVMEDPVVEVETTTTTDEDSSTTRDGATGVRSVNGDAVGLYGGTENQSRCNRDGMSEFLESNPDKAGAFVDALNADPGLRWAGGQQVGVGDVPEYLETLTPVTLTRDTRVTNHGYANGRPTPRQSVLQAGTAVLVDTYGVPRARCACGNPLIPPAQVPSTPTYSGTPWPAWNPENVVVVSQVDVEIDVFVLVDLETGERIERPAGTTGEEDVTAEEETTTTTEPSESTTTVELGTGDVQVTLRWEGDADLDLHVTDPDGAEIYFGQPTSASGGQLDVDKIPSTGDAGPHVENVFWPPGGAPAGDYEAWVINFGGDPNQFSLEVTVDGEVVETLESTVTPTQESDRVLFSF